MQYWTYKISTGEIFDPNGVFIGPKGYSGYADNKNDVTKQNVPHEGPIPAGWYIIKDAYNHKNLGPLTMNLEPFKGNEMYGRSLFRIHGLGFDNPDTPVDESQLSSHGCICQVRRVRSVINNSKVKLLKVIE